MRRHDASNSKLSRGGLMSYPAPLACQSVPRLIRLDGSLLPRLASLALCGKLRARLLAAHRRLYLGRRLVLRLGLRLERLLLRRECCKEVRAASFALCLLELEYELGVGEQPLAHVTDLTGREWRGEGVVGKAS